MFSIESKTSQARRKRSAREAGVAWQAARKLTAHTAQEPGNRIVGRGWGDLARTESRMLQEVAEV